MNTTENKNCLPYRAITQLLDRSGMEKLHCHLGDNSWQLDAKKTTLTKEFHFATYYQTIAFVNAIAWMTNIENYHPDLEISANYCKVHCTSHELGGLTETDFICARKINQLYLTHEEVGHARRAS